MATVYAVASSKGGVGKTTTTVNLGATLASAGLSVAVVDGDLGMANLGDALGVDPDGATLHDVLADDAAVEDAVYEGPEGLAVVPGDTSIDGFRAAEPANLATVLDGLDDYDYVLVDTGAGLSHDTVLPLGLADEVVLVSTTERDSLTDTEKTRQVVERLGGTTRGVVLTCVDPDDPNADEVAARLATDVIDAVPVDPVVRESMREADPLPSYAPGSPAASAYRALAAGLTGESIPTPDAVEAETTGEETTDADALVETGERHGDDTEDAAAPDDGDETEDVDPDETQSGDGVTLDAPEADEGVTLTDPSEADADQSEDDAVSGDATDAEPADEADAEPAHTEADAGERDESAADADETGDDTETDESSGLTDDDALAADTEPSDDPLAADGADPGDEESDEDAGEPVFTTSLVEEAEPSEDDADENEAADDTELVETDEEDDGEKKGFFGRLLG
jgi:septum site-determining protein MinD